jgi:two-component system sensor histidine kinase YesM
MQGELAGGLIINLDIAALQRILGRDNIEKRGFFIVQSGNRIIFSYDPLEQGAPWNPDSSETNALSFFTSMKGTLFNLDYYYRGGLSKYQIQVKRVGRILIILLGSVFFLGLFLSYLLTTIAYKPIGQIVDFFQNPEEHLLDSANGNTEELKFIESSIVKMILSNRDLEERLAERIKSLRKLHYTALQLQLNPHFLHNTLESIYWNSIEVFKPDDLVPQSISSLSQFLRQVLSTNLMAIPLEEEVEITKNYGQILRCRFPDTIDIQWAVEPALFKVIVPKLLLQPLIENAFYHGIKPTRRKGTISINAYEQNKILFLEVKDDGKGIAPDKLKELQKDLKEEIPLNEEHIGLMNIYSRLHFLYGEMAELKIESDGYSGTQVTLILSGNIAEGEKEVRNFIVLAGISSFKSEKTVG